MSSTEVSRHTRPIPPLPPPPSSGPDLVLAEHVEALPTVVAQRHLQLPPRRKKFTLDEVLKWYNSNLGQEEKERIDFSNMLQLYTDAGNIREFDSKDDFYKKLFLYYYLDQKSDIERDIVWDIVRPPPEAGGGKKRKSKKRRRKSKKKSKTRRRRR